jgi:hypothetical protein
MTAAGGVGDRHRGQWIPFWQRACQQDRASACRYLAQLHTTYCRAASGWACNELGILQVDKEMDRPAAFASMERGCELGFQPACANVNALMDGGLRPGMARQLWSGRQFWRRVISPYAIKDRVSPDAVAIAVCQAFRMKLSNLTLAIGVGAFLFAPARGWAQPGTAPGNCEVKSEHSFFQFSIQAAFLRCLPEGRSRRRGED